MQIKLNTKCNKNILSAAQSPLPEIELRYVPSN